MKLLKVLGSSLNCTRPRYRLYLLVLFISGCALRPPNVEICTQLPSETAYCSFTIEGPERIVDKDAWKEMQMGRFSMSAESFSKYQVFIEQTCERVNCTAEQKKAQKRVLRRMKEMTKFSMDEQ